ncbi:MAG: phosphatase PAP2 family protein [Ruminococcus sp.]|nr:phosphatase PAP2 family protein [Ruminococcus sp.]
MFDRLDPKEGEILLWIQDHLRADWLTPIMKAITYLGEVGWFWLVVSIGLMIWKKYRPVGVVCLISLVTSFLVNTIVIKHLFERARPYETIGGLTSLVGKQSEYSFPSGHATAAFAVSVIIFMLMPKKFGIPALILAVAISFSRLYVGVHYPTDIIYGCVSATIFSVICALVYKKKVSQKYPAGDRIDQAV